MFHVFYIRRFTGSSIAEADNETTFVHAWFRLDEGNAFWHYNTRAFPRNHAWWDRLHVWAPSIVSFGGKYYMYYTGVDADGNQRIGYAVADAIDTTDTDTTWRVPADNPLFTMRSAAWTKTTHTPEECRDPYVMSDPLQTGRLLMVYTAPDTLDKMVMGLARSDPGDPLSWHDRGYYASTDPYHTTVGRLESPHIFADSAHAAIADSLHVPVGTVPGVVWRLMYTDGAAGPEAANQFEASINSASPLDTAASSWTHPATLSPTYTDGATYNWYGSECLRMGRAYMAGAYNASYIALKRFYWPDGGTDFVASGGQSEASLLGVPWQHGRVPIRFALAELRPGSGRVRLVVETPLAMPGELSLYDVLGRRIRKLANGRLPQGRTYLEWDGRSTEGGVLGSGMYFAQLRMGGGTYNVRVPFWR